MGINQTGDDIRALKIPFLFTLIFSPDPDNNAVFYRKIRMFPIAGECVEDLCVPVHDICGYNPTGSRDKVNGNVWYHHIRSVVVLSSN
jgi:hypothetical protein